MAYRKTSLTKFAALLLTTATLVPAASTVTLREAVQAQSFGEAPAEFPIPESLPEGSKLSVDGSTSMEVTNQVLEKRYEQQYPNVDVQLNATRTDEAIEALLRGDVDLVATGRPLTDAEKAKGLVEVPLEREKLAIILGANNPYQGEISFDQFARIFRGEITNWSEVGGPDKPIRVVDRPDFSDTRRALSTYEVFKDKPFETGATADPVSTDETDAVVSALGEDGIGYAVYSQVEGRSDVRILNMHGTLPDDPRYPYSQYRAYVYKEGATPAALAFLGIAKTRPGEALVTTPPGATAAPATSTPKATATPATPAPSATATKPDETALVPGTTTETTRARGGFPWWLLLLPLLLLPFLFLRGKKAAPVPAAAPAPVPVPPPVPLKAEPRIVLTPRNCRDAYAYWELPSDRLDEAKARGQGGLKVRLYDVTDRAKTAPLPPHTAEFNCVNTEPDLHMPIAVDNRDYLAEVGYVTADNRWVPLAKSEPVRVPACTEADRPGIGLGGVVPAVAGVAAAGAAGATLLQRPASARMVLTPRNCRDAYAYWELPSDRLDEAKARGQGGLKVRLYDVTDRAKTAPLPPHTAEFNCVNTEPDLHMPITVDNRDYLAEVGYVTADNRWVPLAKSEPVRVPACTEAEGVATPEASLATPGLGLAVPAAGLGAAALGTAGAAALSGISGTRSGVTDPRMVLVPRNEHDLYAYWEVPESRLEEVRRQGGQTPMVRLYDVTNRLPGTPLPVHTKQLAVTGTDPDLHIPVEQNNRDYLAEFGYLTADNRWLPIVKSGTVRLPSKMEGGATEEATGGATFPGAAIAGAVTAGAAAVGTGVVSAVERLKGDTPAARSRIVLTPRTHNKGYVYWEASEAAKAALKAEGGTDLKLRIYDATDIDLDRQPPHSFVTYDLQETDQDRFVPLPESDRDYVAEVGYTTPEGGWLGLARSLPVRSDRILGKPSEGSSDAVLGTQPLGVVGGGTATAQPCSLQTVKVHSQHHAVRLDEEQMRYLQEKVATNYYLSPGQYILRIREGVFNYDGDDTHPGEPFVLLWIYGGRVINQKTGIPVQATWSTLNGYADTLVLEVQDPATLCAFFMDTYPDDNRGEVTLSVIKL